MKGVGGILAIVIILSLVGGAMILGGKTTGTIIIGELNTTINNTNFWDNTTLTDLITGNNNTVYTSLGQKLNLTGGTIYSGAGLNTNLYINTDNSNISAISLNRGGVPQAILFANGVTGQVGFQADDTYGFQIGFITSSYEFISITRNGTGYIRLAGGRSSASGWGNTLIVQGGITNEFQAGNLSLRGGLATGSGTNGNVVFNNANGNLNYMTILDSNGNVGIGTTMPTEKLSVMGNALISADYNNLGAEVLSDTGFVDPSYWTFEGDDFAIADGVMTFNFVSGESDFSQAIINFTTPTNPYSSYVFSYTISNSTETILCGVIADSGGGTIGLFDSTNGTYSINITTGSTNSDSVFLVVCGGESGGFNMDDVSLKLAPGGILKADAIEVKGFITSGNGTGYKVMNGTLDVFNGIQFERNINPLVGADTYGQIFQIQDEPTLTGDGLIYQANFHQFRNYLGTPLMTINLNGNIGIGTVSPNYKLDVNGVVNSTGLVINSTAGFTGTCTILGLTSINVKGGIITGCT